MPADLYFDELAQAWEEEGLFARDLFGQLIRVVAKTEEDYSRYVTVTIDGQPILVPKAVPTTDAQGNIVYLDAAGRTIPRATTIYDAACALVEETNSQRRRQGQPPIDNPIPTLCHLPHLRPVGVCRVCSVAAETYEIDPKDPGKRRPKRQEKLVPACVQPVEEGMAVYTLASSDDRQRSKVAASVRVLLELLVSDHLADGGAGLQAGTPPVRAEAMTDLERLVARLGPQLGIDPRRFARPSRSKRAPDESSPLIRVDRNACILCDRCARACNDVKQNFVIARSGKGYAAQIAFDLNDPMGQSSCVECGECMLTCPTTALTFRRPIESEWHRQQVGGEGQAGMEGKSAVTPAEMEDNVLLRTLPWRYRQWNQSSIVRWRLKPGDVLCRLGEYGSTAFIINSGRLGIWLRDVGQVSGAGGASTPPSGRAERLSYNEKRAEIPPLGPPDFTATAEDLIVGESTCLSQYPRNATVRALTDAEVFEVRRNVLFTLQRNPQARELLDRVYRTRALSNHLRKVPLFAALDEADRQKCLEILLRESADASQAGAVGHGPSAQAAGAARRSVELVRVEPGQTIFRQGERADCFYMVRIGYVKVTQTYAGQERVVNYLGPDRSFGEIACIADWPEIRSAMPAELRTTLENRRTSSCTALDDVELVRIDAQTFRTLLTEVPPLREQLVRQAREYLARQQPAEGAGAAPAMASPLLDEFTRQGLFNAQRLLVLDLEACTRCDECTKACSDTHQGITRLIREGLRFDKWLVASSCRSCSDPYCLVGCPVDAIHRDGRRLEIRIEDHCIGCGLCASNCPYGNINMHGQEESAGKQAVIRYRATTCDLCSQIVGDDWRRVSCVFACPHNAAFRMTGPELLARVGETRGR
jgi:CRP-like cAMP-binding protein/Fe-S-cluster-containing hydrogenase component 2